MSRGLPSLCVAAACVIAAAQGVETRRASARSTSLDAFARLPLAFEPNYGQADPSVRFLARGRDATVFLTDTGAVFALGHGPSHRTVRMTFAGARPAADAAGDGLLRGRANYFIGNDPALWRTDVPTFRRVRYTGLYPGVDLVYYSAEGGHLEYDLIVAPGATPDRIRLAFDGTDALTLDPAGNIVARAGDQEIRILRPRIFQETGGPPSAVDGGYVLDPVTREIGFRVASYDPTKPLIVDPGIVYRGRFGSVKMNTAGGIAVDTMGNAYVSGITEDALTFPGPGKSNAAASQGGDKDVLGDKDVFVLKIDAAGSDMIYSTVLGGSGPDGTLNAYRTDLAVDAAGQAYVVGKTGSADYPTTPNNRYNDCALANAPFLTKLDESGSKLVYSTCLGNTSKNSGADAVALGPDATVYVWGKTAGGIPIKNGFQASFGGAEDMFLAKFDTTKSGDASLLYSTYFGGTGTEENFGKGVVVDGDGNAYVTAHTDSKPFTITNNAYSDVCCGNFVAKINPALKDAPSLVYSTFTGLGLDDAAVAVDKAHNVYVIDSVSFIELDATFSTALAAGTTGGSSLAVNTPANTLYYNAGIVDLTDPKKPVASAFPSLFNAPYYSAVDAACNLYRVGSNGDAAIGPFGAIEKGGGNLDAGIEKVVPNDGPLAFVPNLNGNSVTVINTLNNFVVTPAISLDSVAVQPIASAVTPDGAHAFIIEEKITAPQGVVVVVDSKKIAYPKVDVDAEPQNVVVVQNPAAANSAIKAYVAARATGQSGSITVFDADSKSASFAKTLGNVIAVDPNPQGLAAGTDGKHVYVTGVGVSQGSIRVIDTGTDGLLGLPQALEMDDDQPRAIAVSDSLAFVVGARSAKGDGFLEIRTLPSLALAATKGQNPLILAKTPAGIAVHPNGARAYITLQTDSPTDDVVIVDTAADSKTYGQPVGSLSAGAKLANVFPAGVAVHPDGDRLFVALSGQGVVSVVDLTGLHPEQTLSVGATPIAAGPFIGPAPAPDPDADHDGITDSIELGFNAQTQKFEYVKDSFTNQHLCGNAFGHIVNRNGLTLTVENKAGLVITASGPANVTAEVNLCGDPFAHKLSSGDVYAVPPCGSTTVSLKKGPAVEIDLTADAKLSVPAGATVRIVTTGATPQIQNLGSEKSVDLIAGGIVTSIAPNSIFTGNLAPPTMVLPADMFFEATGVLGAVVNYVVQVPDGLVATCTPAAGSTFPIAATLVSCSATDRAGNSLGSGSFTVTVRDTTPPALILPSTTVAEATGPGGAFVTLRASATDIVDGALPVMCSPSLDSMFQLGTTSVACSATDAHANASTGTFNVVVQDTTPPAIAVPPDITTLPTSTAGAAVSFTAIATDLVDGAIAPGCAPAPGSTFPIGTSTVTCAAADRHGNAARASFAVTVLSPMQVTTALISQAGAAGLRQSTGLLANAARSIGSNAGAACNQIGAFVNQVQAQSGKSIAAGAAAVLVEQARGAMAGLGCR